MKFLTIVGVALAILASAGLAQAKGSKPIPTEGAALEQGGDHRHRDHGADQQTR